MEIVDGIHRIDEASRNLAYSNVYLVLAGKKLLVVDTGTPGNAQKTIQYIEKSGRKPSEVSTIILTHYHMDHAGSLKDLKELTGAKVAVGEQDADFVSGKSAYPKPKGLLMRAANSFIKPTPVPVEISLKDGDKIDGLTVVFTPGHTPGSIMLFDEERRALFCGDTLRLENQAVVAGPERFVWDEAKEKESIIKVALLNFDVLLPGHGEYLKGGASDAVKQLAAHL